MSIPPSSSPSELKLWSIAQLFGFSLVIIGTLLYNEVIIIPGSTYAPPKREELEALVENADGYTDEK